MNSVERTRQQLDPIGSLGSRLLSVVLATGAFLYALGMTIRTLDQVSNVMLAILSLLWLAAAALTVVVATSPIRAPFTRSTNLVVQLLAVGAAVLSIASQWGSNHFIQDDFGSVAIGLLLLALGPYRPAPELASTGVLVAIFMGFVTLLELPNLDTTAPPVSFVLVGMTPILALSFGAASYSGSLVSSLERWQLQMKLAVENRTNRLRAGITRAVQQDRVLILSQDVLPFFSHVLEQETLEAEDRARARKIAEAIRRLMVAEADRTWLEVVGVDDGVPEGFLGRTVVDAAGRASSMVTDQRTALRALIVALTDDPAFIVGSMKITLSGTKSVCRGVLTAGFNESEIDLRSVLAPYFAVMRIVFTAFHVDYQHPTLTLRFSYEQR